MCCNAVSLRLFSSRSRLDCSSLQSVDCSGHCPQLHELGLFLDAKTSDLPQVNVPFLALRTLTLGTSFVSEPEPVAAFLSTLCPFGCSLEFGHSWQFDFQDEVMEEAMKTKIAEAAEFWEETEVMYRAASRVRQAEHLRREALEKEVQDLRTRVRIYEDRAKARGVDEGTCVCS